MARLGLPLSHDRLDAPLSEHFGKCKWLGVHEAGQPPRFVRNEGLNGRWVAEAFACGRLDPMPAPAAPDHGPGGHGGCGCGH